MLKPYEILAFLIAAFVFVAFYCVGISYAGPYAGGFVGFPLGVIAAMAAFFVIMFAGYKFETRND